MKKQFLSLAIILTIAMTSCAAPEVTAEADRQPTTVPTDILPTAVPPTTAPSPSPEPAEAQSERDAAITAVANQAQARATENDEFVEAQEEMVLLVGGSLQTFDESRASLNLRPDGTIIRVGPNSIFTVHEMTDGDQPSTRLMLDFGQIWILLSGGSLEVETPSGVASVRGSLLGVSYDPELERMQASCLEGNCSLENEIGAIELTDGQKCFIEGDFGPSDVEFMDEFELQEWINENPDAWEFFDREEIPEWLPEPDLEWLDGEGTYFDWVYDKENPFLEEFLDGDGPLDGDGLGGDGGFDGPLDGGGGDGGGNGDGGGGFDGLFGD